MTQESGTETTSNRKGFRERVEEELIKRLGKNGYARLKNELVDFIRIAKLEPPPKTPEQIRRLVLDAIGAPLFDDSLSGIPGSMEIMGPQHILKAYEVIYKEKGPTNAYNFIRMIMDMPSLAPLNILQALRRFLDNNYIYVKGYTGGVLEGTEDSRPIGDITHEATALGAFAARWLPDQTEDIKAAIRSELGNEYFTRLKGGDRVIDYTPLVE